MGEGLWKVDESSPLPQGGRKNQPSGGGHTSASREKIRQPFLETCARALAPAFLFRWDSSPKEALHLSGWEAGAGRAHPLLTHSKTLYSFPSCS